jgi:hypothetical protein
MWAYVKGMQFSDSLPTSMVVWLGKGAATADATYRCMQRFDGTAGNNAWLDAHGFPHFRIMQLDAANVPQPATVNPEDWMDLPSDDPGNKLVAPNNFVTLNGEEATDNTRGWTPQNTCGSASSGGGTLTEDYHPWWDTASTAQNGRTFWERF